MTVPQKKYFCNRIDEITVRKEVELHKKVGNVKSIRAICVEGMDKGKIKIINWSDLEKLVKIKLKEAFNYNSNFMPNVDLESLLRGFESYKRKADYDYAKQVSEQATQVQKLRDEATKIKDIAMFGSSAEAHLMLKGFIEWAE